MKKLILLLCIAVSAAAQTEKGMYSFGCDILNFQVNEFGGSAKVSPSFEKFIKKNFYLGGAVIIEAQTSEFATASSNTKLAYAGYNFLPDKKTGVHIVAGLAVNRSQSSSLDAFTDNYDTGTFLSVSSRTFLNEFVSLDPSISFTSLYGGSLGISLGISAYLKPKKK